MMISLLLLAAGLLLAGRLLREYLHQLEWTAVRIGPGWALAALAVNLCYVGLYARLWLALADASALRLPARSAYGITFRALAFKYLPVRVAGVGYRLWAYHQRGGWPVARVAMALYGETALVFISGILVLILFGPWNRWDALGLGHLPLGFAVVLLVGTVLLPRLLDWAARRASWHALRPLAIAARLSLSGSLLLRYAGAWLVLGSGLWLTVGALGQDLSLENLRVCLWAYPLAGLVGMAALFAPAGLGVREGVLALALGTVLPPATAALAALAARICILGAEMTAAVIGQWLLKPAPVSIE